MELWQLNNLSIGISIHAPREGCDVEWMALGLLVLRFQSTHPARGATLVSTTPTPWASNFNPRTPRGVRLAIIEAAAARERFQSTHPARGATNSKAFWASRKVISIHAPREGCDASHRLAPHRSAPFQSTHPARGATLSRDPGLTIAPGFQSTHPARGATRGTNLAATIRSNFNPRTPRGVRPW